MWSQDRHIRILTLLNERQRLTTDSFAAELGVSRETVRRDLIELEQLGKLNRVHGGAVPCDPSHVQPEASYLDRVTMQRDEKRAIAHTAAALLVPGQSCFIDAGSTTHALAQAIAEGPSKSLRVITNSFDVAIVLSGLPEIELHLLGGQLTGDMPATYGAFTVHEITRFQVDLAIISPTALCPERGAMDYVSAEAAVARTMIGHATACMLLADANKLGLSSRMQVCKPAAITTLVTDSRADPAVLEQCRKAGIPRVLVA